MKVLMLEDNLNDAAIIRRILEKELDIEEFKIVDDQKGFVTELYKDYDIILSDYTLPGYTGMDALRLRNELKPEIPFLIVTGSVNETVAVECMTEGADNYILKDNLGRLIQAIIKAMDAKSNLKAKLAAEHQLKEVVNRYNSLVEFSGLGILIVNHSNEVLFTNERLKTILGFDVDCVGCLAKAKLISIKSENDEDLFFETKLSDFEVCIHRESGQKIYLSVHQEPYYNQSILKGKLYVIQDISDKKKKDLVTDIINRLARKSMTNKGLDDFIAYSFNLFQELIQAENFYIALYRKENETYDFAFFHDNRDVMKNRLNHDLSKSITDFVRRTGEPLFLTKSMIEAKELKGEIILNGTKPEIWLGVPLEFENETIGVICMQDYNKNSALGTDELALLERFAPWVSMKIMQDDMMVKVLEREKRFSDLFISSPNAIVVHQNGIIKMANPAAVKLAELDSEDSILGRSVFDFVDKSFLPVTQQRAEAAHRGEVSPTIIEKLITAKGTELYAEVSTIPFSLEGIPASQVIMKDITSEYKSKKLLAESEEKFRVAFKASLDAITITEMSTGKYVEVNEAFYRYTGYSEAETIGNSSFGMDIWVDPRDRELVLDEIRTKGYINNYKARFRMKSGKIEVGLVSASIITFDSKNYVVMMTRIITDFVEAIRQMEISEQKFNQIFNLASDPIILYKYNGNLKIVDINESFTELYGYSRNEIINKPVELIVAESKHSIIIGNLQKLRLDKNILFESIHKKKDGTKFHVEISARQIIIDDEKFIISIERDISDRKIAEERLRKSEQKNSDLWKLFRNVADNVQAMLWAKDMENRFIFTNKYICDHLLIAEDVKEPIGKNDLFFAFRQRESHPELPNYHTFGETCVDSDAVVMKSGKTGRFQEYGHVKGEFLYLDVIKSPLFDENGVMIGTVGSARDITEFKRFEKEIVESEERFRSGFTTSPDALAIFDFFSGRPVELNESFEKLTGYKINNWPQDHYLSPFFNTENHYQDFVAILQSEGQVRNAEFEFVSFNNSKHHLLLSAVLIMLKENPHIMFIIKDITEMVIIRQELEKARQKAEESDKLKSAFLANMSHEIRTPMNHIIGFTEFIKQGVSEDELQSYIEIIQRSSNHLLSLINDIIDISKIEAGQVKLNLTDLNPYMVIKELYEMFARDKRLVNNKLLHLVNYTTFSVENRITADRTRLMQVLINLLGNALKFTTKGVINIGYEPDGKGNLVFFVKDTGCGIPESKVDVIFERFRQIQTTKNMQNEGTGLGLALSKAFVELMGGSIWAESKEGVGSSFYFSLPLSSATMSVNKVKNKNDKSLVAALSLMDESDEFLFKTFLRSINPDIEVFNLEFNENGSLVNFDIQPTLLFLSYSEQSEKTLIKLESINKIFPFLPLVIVLDYKNQPIDFDISSYNFIGFIEKPLSKKRIAEILVKANKGS